LADGRGKESARPLASPIKLSGRLTAEHLDQPLPSGLPLLLKDRDATRQLGMQLMSRISGLGWG
jgi:hypothetical protein